jgi:cytoskeletal protein RodZ
MASKRSASNVLEFLIATLVLSCLLGLLIPVAYRVHEVSENIRYTKQTKENDAASGDMEKISAPKRLAKSSSVAISQSDRQTSY